MNTIFNNAISGRAFETDPNSQRHYFMHLYSAFQRNPRTLCLEVGRRDKTKQLNTNTEKKIIIKCV